jgi:GT2 family glycosyltransferase
MDQNTKIPPATVDAIVIGRNEGARLVACLAALVGQVRRVVYVDSGSSDNSVAAARATGATVVELDLSRGFTAARARNAGLAASANDMPEFVQFLDGDCVLDPGWIVAAAAFMAQTPKVAVVCGRRREMFPEASIYNRMIDAEWNTPVGQAKACGGDALMRAAAVNSAGGYTETLIAGEEPELCLRLRVAGWQVWRLEAEMTLHDAAMSRFSQWWQRSKRAGHAYAEGAAIHGAPPERHWVRETQRAIIWGGALPLLVLALATFWHPKALFLLLVYPLQALRLSRRTGWMPAILSVVGKFAEAQGCADFWWRRLRGRRRGLIEYK